MSVIQGEIFRHFTESNHHGFLENISFQIIDRVLGDSRLIGGFWQFMLHSFMPEVLNVRFVDL